MKEIYISILQTHNMKGHDSVSFPKSASPAKIFSNYLHEPQETELKEIIINFVKEFKEFNEDTNSSMN